MASAVSFAMPGVCPDCGGKRSIRAARCRRCLGISQRKPPAFCCDCGKRLARRDSLRCNGCKRTPEWRANQAAKIKAHIATSPAYSAFLHNSMRYKPRQPGPAARRRQGQRHTETSLGWCPVEYRPLYRRLAQHRSAAAARQLLETRFGGPFQPVSMTWPQYVRRCCTVGSSTVRFTPQCAELLFVLLLQPPNVSLRDNDLIPMIWPDPDFEPDYAAGVIKTYVHSLRRAGVVIVWRAKFGYRIPAETRRRGSCPAVVA